uniref:Uncharacterized protein n=1 Tax=Rhizophora mucronata TaxID=61149 RepID=A0A2P2NV73_RHIMU
MCPLSECVSQETCIFVVHLRLYVELIPQENEYFLLSMVQSIFIV